MTGYGLWLESGPKKRTTMVHVLDLLGCVAVGPTTPEAVAATPDAIAAYRRFLHRHGEAIDLADPIETTVVEHVTEGDWLGNGSPYLTFDRDLAPMDDEAEIGRLLTRSAAILEALAAWVETQPDEALDTEPEKGRSARGIVLHVLGTQGVYFSAALGGAPGFGRVHGAAERGELPLAEALRCTIPMTAELVRSTTPEQRAGVRHLSSRTYTLRKAFRRQLEHPWEHLAELSRRPGGPDL